MTVNAPPVTSAPTGHRRRWVWPLVAVLALGAGLRVAAILTVGDVPRPHGDEGYYVAAGRSLARGEGYPDSVRPPGVPFLVAAAFLTWGESLTAVRLAQVPVSLVIVAVVFALALRRFGLRAATAAGGLCAVH